MHSAFISHSWHDKRLAKKIANALEEAGGRVWIDEAEIKLGDSLIEKIRAGIDSVDFVIALISDKSSSSQWVSKELDIAMNQEIEGRRVKVLPILAGKCELPGFLKGKLYADMSNTKSFRQSLPVLLDRLGASPIDTRQARSVKPLRGSEEDPWIPKFGKNIASDDPVKIYTALKDAPAWKASDLLEHAGVLERVFDLTEKAQPTHIRLRALEIIAHLEDSNFAYRIEPFLNDESINIRCETVRCLSSLEAEKSSATVLQVLRSSRDSAATNACLDFFSKVSVYDSATAISLYSICSTTMSNSSGDAGTELRIASVTVRQMGGRAEIAQPLVLASLRSSNNLVCEKALEGLLEVGDIFLPSPKLRQELAEAILECSRRDSPTVAAKSWLAIILLAESLPLFENRECLWESVLSADRWSIEAWLEDLNDYNLEAIFDDQIDVQRMMLLHGKFGSHVDSLILAALCEIGNEESLKFVSTTNYSPEGWTKVYLLRAIVRLSVWNAQFARLLKAASLELPDYTGGEGQALSLLARHKAGMIGSSVLLSQFPSRVSGIYVGAKTDREIIKGELTDLKDRADRIDKAKISTLLRRIARNDE